MNALTGLKGLFGIPDYKNQQSVGLGKDQSIPSHSLIVERIRQGGGVIYSAQMSQSTSGTADTKNGTTAFNPLGLTKGGLSRTAAGIYVMTLSDFTAAAITDQFTIDSTKLRVRALSNTADRIVGAVTKAYSSGTLTLTFYVYATAGITGAALVGGDTSEFFFELIHE